MTTSNTSTASTKSTTIDAAEALRLAKAAREAKLKAKSEPKNEAPKTTTNRVPKPKLSESEKAALKAEKDAKREAKALISAEKKTAAEAEKAEKRAAREAKKAAKAGEAKPVPHVAKVERSTSELPALPDGLQSFSDQFATLPASVASILLAHLENDLRYRQVVASNGIKDITEGTVVEIIAGPAEFIGAVGRVTKAQRIRCFVEIEGESKPVYLFLADVRKVSEDAGETAEDDTETDDTVELSDSDVETDEVSTDEAAVA